MYKVLFFDTENATRSILAEAILNKRGAGRFEAFSAGSHPVEQINPKAIEVLVKAQLSTENLYSKSVASLEEQVGSDFDFIFVLCDKAVETCPVLADHTITSVWDLESPYEHDDIDVIHNILQALDSRINLLMQLPIEKLEHLKLVQEVKNI